MADRVTEHMIVVAIEVIARMTKLTYRYEHVMTWHTVYCENSRMAYANNKRDLLAQLEAVQNQLFTLQRFNKI